jgi:hypothetical protein
MKKLLDSISLISLQNTHRDLENSLTKISPEKAKKVAIHFTFFDLALKEGLVRQIAGMKTQRELTLPMPEKAIEINDADIIFYPHFPHK